MAGSQPKKQLIFDILEILKKYTDSEHTLSQKEIAELLKKEYQMEADRKSIKTNLMNLNDFGYEVQYKEVPKKVRNSKTNELEDSATLSGFYLEREFSDSELRLLIDSLLFSRHLPYKQCKDLIEKLEGQSNKYFKSRVKYIATMPEDRTDNKQLFYNIDVIDEAIAKRKKISFKYIDYDTNMKPYTKTMRNGNDTYIVTPYQMVAKEGKYYLICNFSNYNHVSNYRVDRITEIRMLEDKAKPFKELRGSNGQPLNLKEYMNEHIYMYSGDTGNIKLRISNAMIIDIIDMFGKNVAFYDQDETHVKVRVKANERAVVQFAKNYAPDVEILEPQRLRDQVISEIRSALAVYEKE